jgi:hypothetical protein
LLWLSTLGLIPFDLTTLDSSNFTVSISESLHDNTSSAKSKAADDRVNARVTTSQGLIQDIVVICKSYLSETGLPREAAAFCLAGLLSRHDLNKTRNVSAGFNVLDSLIDWFCACITAYITNPGGVDELISASPALAGSETDEGSDNDQGSDQRATPSLPQIHSKSYCLVLGVMQCLAQTLKKCERDVFLPHVVRILTVIELYITTISSTAGSQAKSAKLTKLCTKIVQRIGMTILPARVAKWRYQRGQRSLLDNLKSSHSQDKMDRDNSSGCSKSNPVDSNQEADDEDFNFSVDDISRLEYILDILIHNLQDKDTVVRWSAAKGVGRITMRLPQHLANDVINSVIGTCFEDIDNDSAYHGGCLAIAELARRGLLLPEKLQEDGALVRIIESACVYDILRGQHSVGAHVRDAGCYVCWAFARAYSPAVIRPIVDKLSASMLIASVFDREINCRRAAAAAFQENVGRQGAETFVHGIEIISVADYFTVGNRGNAFLNIAPAIAKLKPDLYPVFIGHLHSKKLNHWDIDIRTLASKAIAKLCVSQLQNLTQRSEFSGDFSGSTIISLVRQLLADCLSANLPKRHGSLLAISEIILALSVTTGIATHGAHPTGAEMDISTVHEVLGSKICTEIIDIVSKIESKNLYRGRGGEIVRCAVCLLLESVCKCGIQVSLAQLMTLLASVNKNVMQPHQYIQQAAAGALRQLLCVYALKYVDTSPPSKAVSTIDRIYSQTVTVYVEGLLANTDGNVAVSRGSALALGVLPVCLLTYHDASSSSKAALDSVLNALIATASPFSKVGDSADANTRCNALMALSELLDRLEAAVFPEISSEGIFILTPAILERIFNCFRSSCEDYNIDARGDVGSWSRVCACVGLEKWLYVTMRMYWKSLHGFPAAHSTETQDKSIKIGGTYYTCHGICVVTNISTPSPNFDGAYHHKSKAVVNVIFPSMSSGAFEANDSASTAGSSTTTSTITSSNTHAGVDISGLVVAMSKMKDTEAILLASSLSPCPYEYYLDLCVDDVRDQSRRRAVAIAAASSTSTALTDAASRSGRYLAHESLQAYSTAIVCLLLKQLAEKLDAVREVCGSILSRILSNSSPDCCFIMNKRHLRGLELRNISAASMGNNSLQSIHWLNPKATFRYLFDVVAQVCSKDRCSQQYFDAIMSGIVVSVGCLTENIASASSELLLEFTSGLKSGRFIDTGRAGIDLVHFANYLLRFVKSSRGKDRVLVPLLVTINLLLKNGVFDTLDDLMSTFSWDLYTEINDEMTVSAQKSSDIKKIVQCAEILCLLLTINRNNKTRCQCLKALVILLGHKYPRLRKVVAELLYIQCLSDNSCVGPAFVEDAEVAYSRDANLERCGFVRNQADLDNLMTTLTSTSWETITPLKAREVRGTIVELLGLVMRSKAAENLTAGETGGATEAKSKKDKVKTTEDELDSYGSLVRDAGIYVYHLVPHSEHNVTGCAAGY